MLRREFLFATGAVGLSACTALPQSRKEPQYYPVKSSLDRVIKNVVGLRPYRTAGYRLEAETFDNKKIVHNYGHGGGGISLSWGTSSIATQLALESSPQSVAVVGSGVMGITCALILARQGVKVTVYAAEFPPHTTSNIAAALWLPTSYYDRKEVSEDFLAKDKQISRAALEGFYGYVNQPDYGVFWHDYHFLSHRLPKRKRELPGGNDLYPQYKVSTENNLFGYAYQEKMKSLMIDPSFYLQRIKLDAQISGATFQRKKFGSLQEVLSLKENVIINCTGLGAKDLFNDDKLLPVQGQLTLLLPQPEINYSYVAVDPNEFYYMFPRKGAIILGGTTIRNAYSTKPDEALSRKMVSAHANLASRL
ncbi:FAD-dependent oxidoreductase [Sessilibacter corallicola]|uniref:FAD-dependent oxidoreductase n=1 Tax=Sessilibacter corallicola TaxID=2904075 RepID=UPI001E636403|nr:FAD-dependent oxidoreductase [Sessilibacter corallicola]